MFTLSPSGRLSGTQFTGLAAPFDIERASRKGHSTSGDFECDEFNSEGQIASAVKQLFGAIAVLQFSSP